MAQGTGVDPGGRATGDVSVARRTRRRLPGRQLRTGKRDAGGAVYLLRSWPRRHLAGGWVAHQHACAAAQPRNSRDQVRLRQSGSGRREKWRQCGNARIHDASRTKGTCGSRLVRVNRYCVAPNAPRVPTCRGRQVRRAPHNALLADRQASDRALAARGRSPRRRLDVPAPPRVVVTLIPLGEPGREVLDAAIEHSLARAARRVPPRCVLPGPERAVQFSHGTIDVTGRVQAGAEPIPKRCIAGARATKPADARPKLHYLQPTSVTCVFPITVVPLFSEFDPSTVTPSLAEAK